MTSRSLLSRMRHLEKRLGPPPPWLPIRDRMREAAFALLLTPEELQRLVRPQSKSEMEETMKDLNAAYPDFDKRLLLAQEIVTLRLTGKSYAEVLRESGAYLDPHFEILHGVRLNVASVLLTGELFQDFRRHNEEDELRSDKEEDTA
jgi:hypothetical protein